VLSKCANPECPTTFRYLHDGKLYFIDNQSKGADRKLSGYAGRLKAFECAWLCPSCCRVMTIRVDEGLGLLVIRKSEVTKRRDRDGVSDIDG